MEEHKNNFQTFRRGNQNCAAGSKNCALRKQSIGAKRGGGEGASRRGRQGQCPRNQGERHADCRAELGAAVAVAKESGDWWKLMVPRHGQPLSE